MIDFKRGAKVTGSKFYFMTGDDAIREWSLLNHMIKYHMKSGYEFVIPPFLVNEKTATVAGLLPRFKGDYYKADSFMLIPTAETPLVGMHMDEILNEDDLPIKYVAFSPCFRKEAGSYGERDKGLKRVHQFHKIELFVICKPDDSEQMHAEMVKHVEKLLTEFNLIHRQVELKEKDKPPVSNKTIDLEIKVNDEWLEISSISNTGINQSKNGLIRYRPKNGGKTIRCHLLNGSGVALPRLHLAMLEQSQKRTQIQ